MGYHGLTNWDHGSDVQEPIVLVLPDIETGIDYTVKINTQIYRETTHVLDFLQANFRTRTRRGLMT